MYIMLKRGLFVLLMIILSSFVSSTDFYVSTTGSDSNSGTISSPWGSLGHALTSLGPGDNLYLREGTYYESGISIGLDGTSSQPITIQSYPGEQAVIDGGVPYFKTTDQGEWELVDETISLYRSTRTFSGDFVGAWMMDYGIQVIEYGSSETAACCSGSGIDSTIYTPSGSTPIYMGPGVEITDNHIYIRLELGPDDRYTYEGDPINFPTDPDPNHHRINIFTTDRLISFSGASYLILRDIEFVGAIRIMQWDSSTHNIKLDGCTIKHNRYGILTGGLDSEIHDCVFDNGMPEYVFWTDVKNGCNECNEAASEFQSFALNGPMNGFYIHHNVFKNTMDGVWVTGGQDIRITENTFMNTRDDALNLVWGVGAEIDRNMFWRVVAGISLNPGSDSSGGHAYIHHNIIDNTYYQRGGRPGNYRQNVWPEWSVVAPFSRHGSVNANAYWKLYQNTILVRKGGYGHAADLSIISENPEKYVYNNLFYSMDDCGIFSSIGANYEGNVYWQVSADDSYSGQDKIDPGFDDNLIDDSNFDSSTIWDRYMPTNPLVFTQGVTIPVNWPGSDDTGYRGALNSVEDCVGQGFFCCSYACSSTKSGSGCGAGICCASQNDCVEVCVPMTTAKLSAYIDQWKSGSVEIGELMEVIGLWKKGC